MFYQLSSDASQAETNWCVFLTCRTTTYGVYITTQPFKTPMEGELANVEVKTTTLNEDTSDYHTLPDEDSAEQLKKEPVEDGPCDVRPHPSVMKTKSSKPTFVASIDLNKHVGHLQMLTSTVLVPTGPYITLPSPYKKFLDPDPGGTSHPPPEPGVAANEVQYDTPESITQMVEPMQATN